MVSPADRKILDCCGELGITSQVPRPSCELGNLTRILPTGYHKALARIPFPIQSPVNETFATWLDRCLVEASQNGERWPGEMRRGEGWLLSPGEGCSRDKSAGRRCPTVRSLVF